MTSDFPTANACWPSLKLVSDSNENLNDREFVPENETMIFNKTQDEDLTESKVELEKVDTAEYSEKKLSKKAENPTMSDSFDKNESLMNSLALLTNNEVALVNISQIHSVDNSTKPSLILTDDIVVSERNFTETN